MAEQIFLSDSRTAVDRKYVGFTPNGGSIKPVHVAGGAFRSIYGKYNATMSIKRLALVSDAKGVVPKGNELDTIYDLMKEGEKIEESVTPNALESLRNVMQRLLSADKGVYVVKGLKDDMISYTAGSSYFITRRSMYEDTGEFIGGLIKEYCPDLADYIKDVLSSANDPIQPSPVFIPEAVLINPYTIKEGITKARSCPGLCTVEPVPARGWSAYSWARSLGYTVSPLH